VKRLRDAFVIAAFWAAMSAATLAAGLISTVIGRSRK